MLGCFKNLNLFNVPSSLVHSRIKKVGDFETVRHQIVASLFHLYCANGLRTMIISVIIYFTLSGALLIILEFA